MSTVSRVHGTVGSALYTLHGGMPSEIPQSQPLRVSLSFFLFCFVRPFFFGPLASISVLGHGYIGTYLLRTSFPTLHVLSSSRCCAEVYLVCRRPASGRRILRSPPCPLSLEHSTSRPSEGDSVLAGARASGRLLAPLCGCRSAARCDSRHLNSSTRKSAPRAPRAVRSRAAKGRRAPQSDDSPSFPTGSGPSRFET